MSARCSTAGDEVGCVSTVSCQRAWFALSWVCVWRVVDTRGGGCQVGASATFSLWKVLQGCCLAERFRGSLGSCLFSSKTKLFADRFGSLGGRSVSSGERLAQGALSPHEPETPGPVGLRGLEVPTSAAPSLQIPAPGNRRQALPGKELFTKGKLPQLHCQGLRVIPAHPGGGGGCVCVEKDPEEPLERPVSR